MESLELLLLRELQDDESESLSLSSLELVDIRSLPLLVPFFCLRSSFLFKSENEEND
jgi:hypothetical protein